MPTERYFPVGNQPEINSVGARKIERKVSLRIWPGDCSDNAFNTNFFSCLLLPRLFIPNFINTPSHANDKNASEIKSVNLQLESVLLRFEAVTGM